MDNGWGLNRGLILRLKFNQCVIQGYTYLYDTLLSLIETGNFLNLVYINQFYYYTKYSASIVYFLIIYARAYIYTSTYMKKF